MFVVLRLLAFAGLISFCLGSAASAMPENIGRADRVKNTVTGQLGGKRTRLKVGTSVFRKQRIRARANSSAQIRFKDDTRLAVNANASVVLDKAVFSGKKPKSLVLKAARGAFRFASGNLRKDAYKIITPSSTVGVRGTMMDVFVGGRGETIILLLQGRLQACNKAGQCRVLSNPCDCVRIERNGRMTVSRGLTRAVLRGNRAKRVAPFMFYQSQLLNSMKVNRWIVRRCVDAANPEGYDFNGDPADNDGPSGPPQGGGGGRGGGGEGDP
ncbi:MAG: FecR domain-containing protein [Pseudomonadota bacterium]